MLIWDYSNLIYVPLQQPSRCYMCAWMPRIKEAASGPARSRTPLLNRELLSHNRSEYCRSHLQGVFGTGTSEMQACVSPASNCLREPSSLEAFTLTISDSAFVSRDCCCSGSWPPLRQPQKPTLHRQGASITRACTSKPFTIPLG